RFYVIDAYKVAHETGMGVRINTVMQTCFFAISGILPQEEAIEAIKRSIKKTYGKKGEAIVRKNYACVDASVANLHEVRVPSSVTSGFSMKPAVSDEAPDFVRKLLAPMLVNEGDGITVGEAALAVDGTFPTGTTQWEKRNIAMEIPVWDPDTCIQCGKCVLVCPHAVIRSKIYDGEQLEGAPATFKSTEAKWPSFKEKQYTLQISPEDCTGCGLCVQNCPARSKKEEGRKAIAMSPQPPLRDAERENWEFFLSLPDMDRTRLNLGAVKDIQLLRPLFEFSGACAGCGETPYVKLLSQLFGDRALIANATGCSSIYSGNLPTTPWAVNAEGRGPSWSNSLFEDNAEFGLGMRLALDKQRQYALELLDELKDLVGADLAAALAGASQNDEKDLAAQRERIAGLKALLAGREDPKSKDLLSLADVLARKSVWILGGDGWAYDIGYGGLDHVLASGRNVNILVLDTEVYSNTGGQMSKSTPMGAVAKFAAGGKPAMKKDLALMAMAYGNVYVARVALGASDAQVVKAFREAEAYDGPSLIIAYAHCIAHGIDLKNGLEQQKKAVASGHWITLRYDPDLRREGKNPLTLDSREPSLPLEEYIYGENRYRILQRSNPAEAERLLERVKAENAYRWKLYLHMAAMNDA
ncbi:4Fe-4S dicluster domain-containing protein, partial [Desulfovibrio sp.]